MSSRPSSNTANKPTGPAPIIRTSVLIVSLILIVLVVPANAGLFLWVSRQFSAYARSGNFDETQQFRERLLGGLSTGGKGDFRFGIKGFAAAKDRDQVVHGPGAVCHRPHIALRHHAVHMFGGFGADPHREAGGKQQFQRARLGDDASTGG